MSVTPAAAVGAAITAPYKQQGIAKTAKDFEAGPIARIPLPARVPAGFHGTWAPGAQVAA